MSNYQNRLGSHYKRYEKKNIVEFNRPENTYNTYDNAYSLDYNNPFSTTQEPDIEYEQTEYYLTVTSADRDVSLYPSVSQYVINFQNDFKNIHSIELIQAIIPDKNNVTREPYLLLNIDEIPDVMISNNKSISNAFAILQMAPAIQNNYFIHIDKRIHENTVKYFKTPKASLSKMTIKITDWNGDLFDFGTDTPNPPHKDYQNTFVFKIVCLDKKRTALAHRNVF
jgi:hypothetical protein